MEQTSVWRLVDANLNRALEGLRTLEDCARFGLDQSSLARGLKELRHELATITAAWSRADRLAARDVPGDVGTTIKTESEHARVDVLAIVAAAAGRAQESLRTLAEFGKLIDPASATRLEPLRYRLYTLAADLELSLGRRRLLNGRRLYVLVDACASSEVLATLLQAILEAGVQIVQLRDKGCEDRTLYERGLVARQVTRAADALLIMNDRADLAVAVDADGVHVGQTELPVAAARRVVGAQRLVGLSTHGIDQAREAERMQVDYIGCGPTFASGTKAFTEFTGIEYLQVVAAEIRCPAFAIGGIDLDNVSRVVATGVHGLAVSGAVTRAADPAEVVRAMRTELDRRGEGA